MKLKAILVFSCHLIVSGAIGEKVSASVPAGIDQTEIPREGLKNFKPLIEDLSFTLSLNPLEKQALEATLTSGVRMAASLSRYVLYTSELEGNTFPTQDTALCLRKSDKAKWLVRVPRNNDFEIVASVVASKLFANLTDLSGTNLEMKYVVDNTTTSEPVLVGAAFRLPNIR